MTNTFKMLYDPLRNIDWTREDFYIQVGVTEHVEAIELEVVIYAWDYHRCYKYDVSGHYRCMETEKKVLEVLYLWWSLRLFDMEEVATKIMTESLVHNLFV